MTKPIEWTEISDTTTRTTLHKEWRVTVERGGKTFLLGGGNAAATPADLIAALAAMGEGDRETVLSASWNGIVMRGDYEHVVAERNEATARAEKAERERSEWRTQAHHELGARPNESLADAAIRMRTRAEKAERECAKQRELLELVRGQRDVTDQALECERECRLRNEAELAKARLELDRVRASLDVVRHDLDGTRQELREAREARDRSARLRDAMMPDTRAALDAAHDEDAVTAARRVVAERDSLRTRCIAAETALTKKGALWVESKTADPPKPREYPLAEGSRWDGDEIVDLDGTRTSAVGRTGGAHIWCVGPWGEKRFPRLENVLALAHRRGLL